MKSKYTRLKTKVPRAVRKAALYAIKTGRGLEAVGTYNRCADDINKKSYYEQQVREHIVRPYELI